MPPAIETDPLVSLLDAAPDGILFTDGHGRVLACNLAFRRMADVVGLGLDGVFADRALEVAERTTEPYAFAAAAGRLSEEAGGLEFEDAVGGCVFRLDASPPAPAGRVWTLRDVTARHREARARDDRVAALGHELRTPLTAMTGFIDLLRDQSTGPLTPDQARYLEIVGRATERLQVLVDELLQQGREAR